ncbi:hypothetical protein D3C71_2158290 [compost metagenome]
MDLFVGAQVECQRLLLQAYAHLAPLGELAGGVLQRLLQPAVLNLQAEGGQ